jgi:hypothetical protein
MEKSFFDVECFARTQKAAFVDVHGSVSGNDWEQGNTPGYQQWEVCNASAYRERSDSYPDS